MFLRHVAPGNVVGDAIVGLRDDRHGPAPRIAERGSITLDHPADRSVMHDPHGMGVRQADGALEVARVAHPVAARHFPVAVEVELSRPHRQGNRIVTPRQHGGHSGVDLRTIVRCRRLQRREADFHSRNVGDRVECARRPAEPKTEIARTLFAHEVQILFAVVEAGQIRRQVIDIRIRKIVGGGRHQRRVGAGTAPAFVRLECIHEIFRVLPGDLWILGQRAGSAVAAMAACAERKFCPTRIDVGIGGPVRSPRA